jgi:Txe/YoeB family toxin of Txe-Axe toxin-antitoxin module
MYNITLTRQAVKDAQKLEQYENTYSRRITIHHRLVYQILPNETDEKDTDCVLYQGIVKIIRMWTHYG